MRPDRPSTTAELVCSWRALEQLLPAQERILSDPHARAFLGPARAALVDAVERLPPRARKALFRRIDRALQGIMTFIVARHRALDDLLVEQEGLSQVVLLGTGYDSRVRRLAGKLPEATLYEVDHPATAARRESLLDAALGEGSRLPRVPVTVDFARESFVERLREAGFDPAQRTVWCWEGVTMYLEQEAVAETLRSIAQNSPPGSLVGFDVWTPPSDGVARLALRDLPALAMRLAYAEPFVWGPDPAELEPFVAEQGLALIELTSSFDLVERYAPGSRPWLARHPHLHLCLAEVDRPLD